MSPGEVAVTLAGALILGAAVLDAVDRAHPTRARSAMFWGSYAATVLVGPRLPDAVNGVLVLLLVAAGARDLGRSDAGSAPPAAREAAARRWGDRLFLPAILVPVLTFGIAKAIPRAGSLLAVACASLVASAFAVVRLRQPVTSPVREARRLLDLIGWAAVLPQMLAMLGVVFAAAGVGDRIADVLGRVFPLDRPLVAVATYTLGMASFTMLLGNAFAAFPVMTAAIGLPVLVTKMGGDPAAVAALGMLSGFCGTLLTPMAANFNVVPVALLELRDPHAVIRAQVPTACALLAANTALLYLFGLPR